MPDDIPPLTLQVLREIRDEVRHTNARLDQTNERLDRLEHRQTEMERHLSTELVAVSKAVLEVRDLLRDNRALQEKVDDHETRIRTLESRSDSIAAKEGPTRPHDPLARPSAASGRSVPPRPSLASLGDLLPAEKSSRAALIFAGSTSERIGLAVCY